MRGNARKTAAKVPRDGNEPGARETRQGALLAQIADGARQYQELERQFGEHPPPELETLLKLHRLLILKFSLEAEGAPEMVRLVKDLMKPVIDWAQLQEQRRKRELAEQKYRDEAEARRAALAHAAEGGGLRPETLKRIEHELKLL